MIDSKGKERQSNLELLRIILIIGVIILYINNASIGGAFAMVEKYSIKYYELQVLETLFIGAVDLFMMISGYFLINNNKRNLWKPIELLFQVVFFSIIKYIINSCILDSFSIRGLMRCLIPSNYFVILYIVVFIISPFINVMINSLVDKNKKLLIILLICIFSVYPTMVDLFQEITKTEFNGLSSVGMYGSQYGYTIINFLLCYIVGAYISIYKEKAFRIKTSRLIWCVFTNIIIVMIWVTINNYTGFYSERSAWEYCNPIVIFNAATIFILFSKMSFTSKLVNDMAKASLTVFLGHDLFIKRKIVEKIISNNPIVMLLCMILYPTLIYVFLYLVNKIYLVIKKLIFSRIEKRHDFWIQV